AIVWRRLGLGSLVAHALTPGVVSQCRETIAELVLIGTLQCVISACAIGGFIGGVGGKLGQRKVVGDSCSRGQNLRRRVQRVVVVVQVTAKGSHTTDLEGIVIGDLLLQGQIEGLYIRGLVVILAAVKADPKTGNLRWIAEVDGAEGVLHGSRLPIGQSDGVN